MDRQTFAEAVYQYCFRLGGSVTSWGRTYAHNIAVHGVHSSPHLQWLAADVVYDSKPDEATARSEAIPLDLTVIREADHDHLQPADWAVAAPDASHRT